MDNQPIQKQENKEEAERRIKRIEYLIKSGWNALDKKKDWKRSHFRFTKAKELLTLPIEVDSDLEHDRQMKTVETQFGLYYSRIIRDRSSEDIIQQDIGGSIREKHRQIEALMKNLGTLKSTSLWNILERRYDKLEILSLAEGRAYEAAEANYAMMRSRRFRFRADRNWRNYLLLTLADYLVGFGHRLRYAFGWIGVIIFGFTSVYFVGHDYIVAQSHLEEAIDRIMPFAWEWEKRYLHSLWISFAMLFVPSQVHVSSDYIIMKAFLVSNAIMQYFVNVGLIALIVNKLAAKRKW